MHRLRPVRAGLSGAGWG
ncbi:hypothetical protein N5D60_13555 [Aeromonas caviae]|nr:hypothetical protein [Aeromonas caviae]MDH1850259.1 hypothetical protein [Aeromonas caviae]